jgi:rare lipoprotein A
MGRVQVIGQAYNLAARVSVGLDQLYPNVNKNVILVPSLTFFVFLRKNMTRSFYLLFLAVAYAVSTPCFAQSETGIITYYADYMQGKPTASGEIYDVQKFTASHKTLPLGTTVKVTNLKNGQSVVLRVNDRHTSATNMLSLSRAAAASIDLIHYGKVTAQMEVVPGGGQALAQNGTVAGNNLIASANPNNRTLNTQPETQLSGPSNTFQAKQLLAATSGRKREVLGYFDLDFKRVKPDGYGVRLVSFAKPKEAVELCRRLQAQGHPDTYIQIQVETDASNTKVGQEYRVVVGQGPEATIRQTFLGFFKNQGYAESVVVKYE